jgi:hypothetical protein
MAGIPKLLAMAVCGKADSLETTWSSLAVKKLGEDALEQHRGSGSHSHEICVYHVASRFLERKVVSPCIFRLPLL